MAGLIYSAALNAREDGALDDHPTCELTDGESVRDHPERGPAADGVRRGRRRRAVGRRELRGQRHDSGDPLRARAALVHRSEPNAGSAFANRLVVSPPDTRSYPARRGHDQFYGWGRVNMDKRGRHHDGGGASARGRDHRPGLVRAGRPGAQLRRRPRAGGACASGCYTCRVLVAPGSSPNNSDAPAGDFIEVPSGHCNGTTARSCAVRRRRRFARRRGAQGALPGEHRRLPPARAGCRHRADLERPPEHRALRLHGQGRRRAHRRHGRS